MRLLVAAPVNLLKIQIRVAQGTRTPALQIKSQSQKNRLLEGSRVEVQLKAFFRSLALTQRTVA